MVCMWALSVQFQFFLAYLAIFIIIAFVRLYGKNIKRLTNFEHPDDNVSQVSPPAWSPVK